MYTLDFKFRNYLPTESTIRYLINFSHKSDLKNYILWLLRLVDHPDVLEAQVNKLADWDRKGSHTWGLIADDVSRAFKENKKLSQSSKDRLKQIFMNENHDPFARKHALKIWGSSPTDEDLKVIQNISSEDEIYNAVLMAKAQYKDYTIVDELVKKIRSDNSEYWWQTTRHIWHENFEQVFEEQILTINDNNYWMLDEIFEKMTIFKAEQLLEKYWEKISHYNIFIEIALLVATDKLVSLVNESIQDRDLKEVFKYFDHRWGFKTTGRKGIYRYEQIMAIKPYIQYLDDHAKSDLFEICLQNGWKDYAIQFIRPLLPSDCQYSPEINTLKLSKELEEGKIIWSDRWLYDCIKDGWNIEESIDILFNWLENNYCDLALKIVASNLESMGRRNDFFRMEAIVENGGNLVSSQEILERTYWSIFIRTLS